MKSIRVHETGPPEVMRLEEVPTPNRRLAKCWSESGRVGVNPVETYIRAGRYPVLAPFHNAGQ